MLTLATPLQVVNSVNHETSHNKRDLLTFYQVM